MLDIKFIIENLETVKQAARDKGITVDLDRLLQLHAQRLEIQKELEQLQKERNANAKELQQSDLPRKEDVIAKGRDLKQRIADLEQKMDPLEHDYNDILWRVPNVPSSDTPVGPGESANKVVAEWGKPQQFDFMVKDHIALGKSLDLIDLERGATASGFRGYYLKNEAALLHMGLMWLGLEKMYKKGYTMMVTPTLVREYALLGSGHFPFGKEEIYMAGNAARMAEESSKDEQYLVGTSEPSLLAYYSDQTLTTQQFPIKVCGISMCYRSEAGSYGKDTKGLYRVHEFMKVEQVIICENDYKLTEQYLEEMRQIAEEILQELELPYRVLQIGTGDMGAGKYKMYDIETWMPSRNNYGETHSDSALGDWQARRLNIRYKDTDGDIKFAHTLNNTVIASPRLLIAIIENYQQADGSIRVPKMLEKYVGKSIIYPNHS